MADIQLVDLWKYYGDVPAVRGINLDIEDSEFIALVGPSGCGKTTTLRMIAGLEDITGGEVAIERKVVNEVPPKDRDIAMVFQNYALYPHMSVYDNMAFGLKLRRTDRGEIDSRVALAAEILNIGSCCIGVRASFPAVNGNGWPWGAPSCGSRGCFCSTNPCPTWMPSCACKCAPRSRRSTSGSRPQWST